MSEPRSSQRRSALPPRDSSVTQVHVDVPAEVVSTAVRSDDDVTVISTRTPGSASSGVPVKPLEVGRLLEGERLGQFELRQFVGGGGMGVVFRGWDTTLNREVAVKVLSRDQSADEETLRRFRNEAQSAARLDHGNIARVYFVGEDRGVHYIVFEFIEGVNLRDLVDRHGPLPVDEALTYTLQVAEALDHASQRDVIHRDIKPSNMLITADGTAKLVDMGLARLHQVEDTQEDLTASGVTLGTFDYISPEQARDPRSADVRSDLYSLGCSLYFMLAGQPPFPRGTVLQKLLQHQGDEPTDLRVLRPDLPAPIVSLVRKMLSKSPAQRHQTPIDLIADIKDLLERLKNPSFVGRLDVRLRSTSQANPFWHKHLPWAVPVALLAIVCLALDFYWSRIEGSSSPTDSEALLATLPPVTSRDTTAAQNSAASVSPSQLSSSNRNSAEPDTSATASTERRKNAGRTTTKANSSTDVTPVDVNRQATIAPSVERPENTAPPTFADPRKGILIVGDAAVGATFSSLEAACRVAKSGDVIELRYSGRREEPPLSITNTKLTIRAGEGFLPIVRFHPVNADPMKFSRAMFSLSGGSLSIVNLAIEFNVPRGVAADFWTLFDLRQSNQLRFEKTSLTIHNGDDDAKAFHPKVSFFLVDASSEGGMPLDSESLPEQGQSLVELQNCIARGEATLASVAAAQSLRLVWHNGLVALSERLLVATGNTAITQPTHVEIEARHLTVDARNGLALLDISRSDTSGLSADIRFSDSIIRVGESAPLVEQIMSMAMAHSNGPLLWSGDRNFYDIAGVFWDLHDGAMPPLGEQMTFVQWRSFWGQPRENLPNLNAVTWQSGPDGGSLMSDRMPTDYALSDRAANNPARDSASDGLDAGCLLYLLPLPPTSEVAPSTSDRSELSGAAISESVEPTSSAE
jgi:serine/threonine protein kinase